MQLFALIVSIASLSAYTLVGVHATKCAVCPKGVVDKATVTRCIGKYNDNTTCYYSSSQKQATCDYDVDGHLWGGDHACPAKASMTSSGCHACPGRVME
ncbi:hypothetical protein PAXRUDRAFT_830046 [Paxillus rubicundulus Ve08.2h10]|uniref:Uncharacterized protein n=1 Tax=Paxillus rubicundulus Ve08.2h10 TaxID=930991 RepID=A0A0D0DLS5_9AGAM|nr:hypothetical protein PAXRUDRAFT_830046 [Paxillus rubicundulus Ve08.2h10]